MKITERLQLIADQINTAHAGSYLNKIVCLSEYDYLLSFSKTKGQHILLSLNVKIPFVKVTDKKFSFNDQNSFHQKLKAKLLNACFLHASVYNSDNILSLEFIKTTDTYDKIRYFLLFEIFKSNSNLILISDNVVVEAFRFKGLDTHHPVIKGAFYNPPIKQGFEKDIQEKDIKSEELYFNSIERHHIDAKYRDISVNLKRKLKSLHKKVENIEEEREKAKHNLRYKDYADYLLSDLSLIKKGDSSFDYFGETVKLNEIYSPTDNIQRFYKLYKKAKLTIVSTNEQYDRANDEIGYIEAILSNLDNYNESDYDDLIKELYERNIVKIPGKFKPKNLKNAANPYYFYFNDVKIGFGKNATQNSNLTFKFASKDDNYAHIKNDHGSHVIIFDKDPSDDVIEFTLGLALFLSKKKDGEVIYAKVKTLKKGNVPGLVLLSNYESYTLKELKYDYANYINEAKRF